MDYKELTELLREWYEYCISDLCGEDVLNCDDFCINRGKDCIVHQAIEGIETLMAERDAAIKILRETNWCAGCIHFKGLKGCANNAMSLCCEGDDHYQFCAPGKGDKSDG